MTVFKAGDTIRMKQACSGLEKGEIVTLSYENAKNQLVDDLYAGNKCSCKENWELVTAAADQKVEEPVKLKPKKGKVIYGGLHIDTWKGDTSHPLIPSEDHEIWYPKEQEKAIAIALQQNISCLLIGETGTGKTSAIKHLARLRKQPYVRVNLNGYTSPDELIGSKSAANGSTYFEEGVIIKAMRDGAVLVVDELNAATPDCMFIFHALLDDERKITLPTGEIVSPHPEFRFFATMNPDYEGTKSINRAFMDRFGVIIHVEVMEPKTEEEYLVKQGVDQQDAHNMVLFAYSYRQVHKEGKTLTFCSTRSLLQWGELIKQGMSIETAFNFSIVGKARMEEKQAMIDVFAASIKKNLSLSDKDTYVLAKQSDLTKIQTEVKEMKQKALEALELVDTKSVENTVLRNQVKALSAGKPPVVGSSPEEIVRELVEIEVLKKSTATDLAARITKHRLEKGLL